MLLWSELCRIGRVIQSLHGLPNGVCTLYHTMQKLHTHTIAFRPIIHFDLSQLSSGLRRRVHCLPLGFERLNDTINWLQVFRRADATRLGSERRQPHQTRAVHEEKYVGL